MRYTILALLFLAACSDSGVNAVDDEIDFEPYRIGTWLVTSHESAEWEGHLPESVNAPAKAAPDTTYYDTPEDLNITIWAEIDDFVALIYRDETFTDQHESAQAISDGNAGFSYSTPFSGGGGTVYFEDGFFHFGTTFRYECGAEIEADEIIQFTVNDKNGDPMQTKQFAVDGMMETIEHIKCG